MRGGSVGRTGGLGTGIKIEKDDRFVAVVVPFCTICSNTR
jgi:hypothetical protein